MASLALMKERRWPTAPSKANWFKLNSEPNISWCLDTKGPSKVASRGLAALNDAKSSLKWRDLTAGGASKWTADKWRRFSLREGSMVAGLTSLGPASGQGAPGPGPGSYKTKENKRTSTSCDACARHHRRQQTRSWHSFCLFSLEQNNFGTNRDQTAPNQTKTKPKPNPITNRPNHFQLENLSKTKFDPAKFPMPSLGGRNWTPILVTNSGHYCDDIIEFNPINHFYSMLQSKQVVEASHHNSWKMKWSNQE